MYTPRHRLTANHWGVGIAEVENGKIKAVRPHPNDAAPAVLNGNLAGTLSGSWRIAKPSVRESFLKHGPNGGGERGAEPFIEVSWDEALDLVARELVRVKSQYGNEGIYAGSYGWASAGRFHHAQGQLKRFLNVFGGYVSSWGNYSYNAALILMPYVIGNFRTQVKNATRLKTVAKHGELLVMFGGLPLRNAQISGGGVGRHRLAGALQECADAGVEFINISPLRTDAHDALNAEWLAPRPGSDTAIMLSLCHTLLTEGLHDPAFLERYTVGFDKLTAYLLGDTDGVPKTVEWAAELSGLDPDRLRKLARQMAHKRTFVTTAAGLQRADFGEQPLWACVALASMLGRIGMPGEGFGLAYAADSSIGTVDRPFRWPAFPQGTNPVSDYIPVAMITEMLERPGEVYEYNGETRRFPDARMVWWAGGNPFHHHQDLNRLRRAFQRPETVIVNDIHWTGIARHADIVLPCAAPAERNDFAGGTQDNALIPMPRLVDPPEGMLTEYAIYTALEERLGLGDTFSRGMSEDDWLREMWSDLESSAGAHGVSVPAFDAFMEGDVLEFNDPAPEATFLADFRADPEAHPLTTPSGKIELYSEQIASFGYDDCPPHATFMAPREWLGTATPDAPLHLISGQPGTRLHGQQDDGAASRAAKVKDREPILINTADAAARGISDGDVVKVFNTRGACLAGAVVTDNVRQGVVFLWTGATYDPDLSDPQHLDRHGNPNVLTHDLRTSRLAQGPAAQSALVDLERFDGPLPAVMAFVPPVKAS